MWLPVSLCRYVVMSSGVARCRQVSLCVVMSSCGHAPLCRYVVTCRYVVMCRHVALLLCRYVVMSSRVAMCRYVVSVVMSLCRYVVTVDLFAIPPCGESVEQGCFLLGCATQPDAGHTRRDAARRATCDAARRDIGTTRDATRRATQDTLFHKGILLVPPPKNEADGT